MLINNAIQILSSARLALGDRSVAMARNIAKGINSSEEQDDLRRRVVLGYCVIKALDKVLVINDNDQIEYILADYDEVKINRLLLYLRDILQAGNRPVLSQILNPIARNRLASSNQGAQGVDGTNAYLYIGYASNQFGDDYSTSATGRTWIGIRQSSVPLSPVDASAFTGLWRQFVGTDGLPGTPGADGNDVFIYQAWADDASGTNFTTTFNSTKKWTAIITSATPLTPVAGDFAGRWVKYIGENGNAGTNGTNGNTILSGSGVPSGGLGVDGDFYRDTNNSNFYGPKTGGLWGTPLDLKGLPGNNGADGNDGADGDDGADAFVYVAYADDASGTGFTNSFSPSKNWIAIKPSTVEINTPTASDFTGLWKKYGGDGDKYATTSSTSLTIATGPQFFTVAPGLSYTTGQRFVMATNGDPNQRMEGLVADYDAATGQFHGIVETITGSGTFAVWDVNLGGAPTGVASQNAYYATIATDQGSGGTPQALSTTPAKISQFDTVVAQSAGMTADASTDTIAVQNNGAYIADFNAVVSGTASADILLQLYLNGTAVPNIITRVKFDGSGTAQNVSFHSVQDSIGQGDSFEVRAVASAATPNLLIEQARFSVYTVGYINSEQYKNFENLDVDTGTETCDNFAASAGYAAKFEYLVRKGTNVRTGVIYAVWDGTNQPTESETTTMDLGDTSPLDLNTDFSGGDIRLRATATTDDWIVKGKRTIIG